MIPLKEFPRMREAYLRVPCDVVEKEEAKSLKDFILEFFPKKGAHAVAAPQIGIQKRAFLAKLKTGWVFACNPVILEKEEPFIFNNEACLSFPGIVKNTLRYKRIKVKYLDEDYEERLVMLEDLEAVIFQHEIDHLNGVLFKDRVQKPFKRATKKIGRNDFCPYCMDSGLIIKWKKCGRHNDGK
ncbi:peptide deformylase [Patescibacteria group bacterium]|nr:peptide deformylase [Patescibacteria group bacterium]